MKLILITSCILSLMVGCSTRERPEEKGLVFVEKMFDLFEGIEKKHLGKDKDSSEVTITKAKLPNPYSLAVYFIQPEKDQEWRWDRKDKDLILSSLHTDKRAGRVFELINTSGKQNDLKNMRVMAAQQGAEGLLLIRGISNLDTSVNAKALSYVALIPMLFVNGNDVNSTFVGQAILWDVRSPYVHLGIESEGGWGMERPFAFKQKDRALEKSKDEALSSLSDKLKTQLPQIKL